MDDRPLTEEEHEERERAREEGKRMATAAIKKLKPQIKAVADVINKANDRIYEDGRKAGYDKALAQLAEMTEECKQMGRREVVEWIERESKTAYIYEGEYAYDTECDNQLMTDLGDWQIEKQVWGVDKPKK